MLDPTLQSLPPMIAQRLPGHEPGCAQPDQAEENEARAEEALNGRID